MIRPAKFSDIPALKKLLRATHRASKYALRMELHDKAMEDMLMALVAGQNQHGPGATYLAVIEASGSEVVGFMAGSLNRVYGIGDKLVATDNFLITNHRAKTSDFLKLIDGYTAWAKANPKVIEIGLSWTDAMHRGEALARLYQRKGFSLVGEQYELRLDLDLEEAA